VFFAPLTVGRLSHVETHPEPSSTAASSPRSSVLPYPLGNPAGLTLRSDPSLSRLPISGPESPGADRGAMRKEPSFFWGRDPPSHPRFAGAPRGAYLAVLLKGRATHPRCNSRVALCQHRIRSFSPQRIFIHCPNSWALATSCGAVKHTLAALLSRLYAGSWIRSSENSSSRHWCENSLIAAARFHDFGVARQGSWNTWVNIPFRAPLGIFRQGLQAQQPKPQPVYAVEDSVEVRLVDNLPREDRLPAFGLDLHLFEGRSEALAELAAYHYPVDRPGALLARHPPILLSPSHTLIR
jgi:hypothetical protein